MPTALNLVLTLCESLRAERILYCHWKSNVALDRSASGDNDLDLLVSRSDVPRFTEILYRLGFKEARLSPAREVPGILDYYGCDRETGRLIHVHAHYQLVVGDDMTKNYHLPIERPFLASACHDGPFQVPAPEFEFIVFVIRMVIKHSTWDAFLIRRGTLSAEERRELVDLQTRASHGLVSDLLRQHLPYIDARLFDECRESLMPDFSIVGRILVGQRLRRRLRAQARRSPISDTTLRVWRRISAMLHWLMFRRVPRRRMAACGSVIALVGGDGAGKSTLASEVRNWLAKQFNTYQIHMGKPPRSCITFAVFAVSKAIVLIGSLFRNNWTVEAGATAESPALLRCLWLLRRICIARDRCRAYAKARRLASNGALVICDRYPIPEVNLMDGPQLHRKLSDRQANRFTELLVRVEERYYQQIMKPDVLIVLRIDPEIAVLRKPEEDPAFVRARSREIWELNWSRSNAHVIDASLPKAEELSIIKDTLWSNL